VARPRTPIGTFGEVILRRTGGGEVEARTRYRDYDGGLRLVSARGTSPAEATRALKAKLAERIAVSPLDTPLTADSSFFTDLVEYWLADLDLEARLAIATREAYERNMRNLVLPSFAELALREIGWRGATPSSSTRRGGATTVHDRPGW
jgi:hypothetical protein